MRVKSLDAMVFGRRGVNERGKKRLFLGVCGTGDASSFINRRCTYREEEIEIHIIVFEYFSFPKKNSIGSGPVTTYIAHRPTHHEDLLITEKL